MKINTKKLYMEALIDMEGFIDSSRYNTKPLKLILLLLGLIGLFIGFIFSNLLSFLIAIALFVISTILSDFIGGKKKLTFKNLFDMS